MSTDQSTLAGTEKAKAARDRLREEGDLSTTHRIGVVDQIVATTDRRTGQGQGQLSAGEVAA
jgi:hypothetical protein